MFGSIWCVILFVYATGELYEGDICQIKEADLGKCTLISQCPWAIEGIKQRIFPRTCGFAGKNPIVCCPEFKSELKVPTGNKSRQNCPELNSQGIKILVIGGKKALNEEFPHMVALAVLGYGDEQEKQWLCGGSLIASNYVLTAAHCVYSQQYGVVKWVRLGDLDLKSTDDNAGPQDFQVKRIIAHPDYKPPSVYHDLALIELDRNIVTSKWVKAACLFTGVEVPNENLIATGWGSTTYSGEASSHLMKVDLKFVGQEECQTKYQTTSRSRLPNGIVDDYQVCAGSADPTKARDTCQGDSGGPLQIYSLKNRAHYEIVGVTSFGKPCGTLETPGIYTRISNYLSWIEEIVWPD